MLDALELDILELEELSLDWLDSEELSLDGLEELGLDGLEELTELDEEELLEELFEDELEDGLELLDIEEFEEELTLEELEDDELDKSSIERICNRSPLRGPGNSNSPVWKFRTSGTLDSPDVRKSVKVACQITLSVNGTVTISVVPARAVS